MVDIGASEFDRATAMTGPVADGADSVWTGELLDGWDIDGNANGGYLLALAGRAMLSASGRAHPVSVTAHYLAPGRPGPVTATTQVVKTGKRFTTVTCALTGGNGREMLRVLGTFGDVTAGAGQSEFVASGPPDVAPYEQCLPRSPAPNRLPTGLMARLNNRLDPRDADFHGLDKRGEAEMRGWFEFADGRPSDPLSLMLAADSFPPAVFHLPLSPGWVPTLELTVHVRDVPAPGRLLCRFSTRFVTNGLFEEDGEVWDSTGRLVAVSRQMSLVARAH